MVPDPEAQKKVWVELLGAETAHAGSLELLRLPGIFIVVGKSRASAVEGSEGSTVPHFGFAVKSYPEMKAKVASAGLVVVTDTPRNKQLIVEFPDKIRVELTEVASIQVPVAMHHIHLATPDPEALRGWYVKTFGAEPAVRANFLAAKIPGGEVDTRKADTAQAPTKGRALDHIGFEVKNLEQFCKNLQAHGVVLESPYREMPQLGGLKIAFLTDPEGTRIELTEGLPK